MTSSGSGHQYSKFNLFTFCELFHIHVTGVAVAIKKMLPFYFDFFLYYHRTKYL